MAETEDGRLELKRFATRCQVKQEPTDVSQDLGRSFDRSQAGAAPSAPTPVGEECHQTGWHSAVIGGSLMSHS